MPRARTLPFIGLVAAASLTLGLVLATQEGSSPATAAGDVLTSPDAGGKNVSLALDGAGRPVIAHTLANGDLRLVHCNDANCAGNNESAVTVDTGAGRTSIDIDSSGRPVVAYARTAGGDTDLRIRRCGNANCTSGNTINAPDTAGNAGNYASIALDASNVPIVSYYDDTNRDLKLVHCGDATCSGASETVTTLDSNGSEGLYTSIALNPSGNAVMSYHEISHGGVVKVRTCDNPTCSTSLGVVPDITGIVGEYSAIALDSTARPVVSYYDTTNANLKVLRCGNVLCTASNFIKTPDSTGSVGSYTSIAIDGAGKPIISYYDSGNGDLKVLHCGDAICEEGNSLASVDTMGNVGQFTSLRLDAAGNPIVAYSDITNGRLKVLHCNDANCTGSQKSGPTPTPTVTPTPCPAASCPDTDGDGCTDAEETGPNEALGGRRSPTNPYDFYDVNGDRTVDLFGDVFTVSAIFGADADNNPPDEPDGYDPDLDRSAPLPGGDPWDMQGPDGMVDLFTDVFGVAEQFGHDCTAPP